MHIQIEAPKEGGIRRLYTLAWPQTVRKTWKQALSQGSVVVALTDGVPDIVPDCAVEGVHHFKFTSERPVDWDIVVERSDELRAVGLPDDRGKLYLQVTSSGTITAVTQPGGAPRLHGNCSDATHWVSAARLGWWQTNWPGTSLKMRSDCSVVSSSKSAPRGCDEPWLIELIALGSGEVGPLCPSPLVWNGFSCHHPNTRKPTSVTCILASPAHPGCSRFPTGREWNSATAFPVGRAADPDDPIDELDRLEQISQSCLCNQSGAVEVGGRFDSGYAPGRLLELWASGSDLADGAETCLRHKFYGFRLRRKYERVQQFHLPCIER